MAAFLADENSGNTRTERDFSEMEIEVEWQNKKALQEGLS